MTRKKAIKLLMSLGFDRNEAKEYLDKNRGPGYSNKSRVYGAWFMAFKKSWSDGDYRFDNPHERSSK